MHLVFSTLGLSGFSYQGKKPWPPLPREVTWWHRVTMEHTVIVGRTTWQATLGSAPLAGRRLVVISSTLRHEEVPTGCALARSLIDAMRLAKETCDVPAVCGGRDVLYQALPFATRAFVFRVRGEDPVDVYFPAAARFTMYPWDIVSLEEHGADEANPRETCFIEYKRSKP